MKMQIAVGVAVAIYFVVLPFSLTKVQAYKKKEHQKRYFVDLEQRDASLMERDPVCQEEIEKERNRLRRIRENIRQQLEEETKAVKQRSV